MLRETSDGQFAGQIRTLFEAGFLGGLADEQLLDRFRSGEERSSGSAFSVLIERHGPMVLGVCRRILDDSHLAEDAFQATFLVLARRAGSVRNRAALGAWLHRVARRIATRLKIKADRQKARERPEVAELAVELTDRLEIGEIRSAIDEEIDRLGDDQRLPIVLCCLEGLSLEEASERLRWPLGTVKSRLARGRQRLQARLARRGLAPTSAVLAGSGAGLFGAEVSAAIRPALIEATSRAVAASMIGGGLTSGVVPAAISVLVREELGSMIALQLKLTLIGSLVAVAVASMATIGIALARPASPRPLVKSGATPTAQQTVQTKPTASAIRLSAVGKIVDAAGKPVADARVILRELAQYRLNEIQTPDGNAIEEIPDIIAETKSDAEGRFEFRDVSAPGFVKTAGVGVDFFPWNVVVLAPGRGLAWETLEKLSDPTPMTLKLGEEGTIRGRVVEPGGKPVVGAKVKVIGIDRLGRPDVNGLGTDNRLNLSWSAFPLGATTDADGRFRVVGLPRDRVISLIVTDSRHERLFDYAATTEVPQADAVGTTYHSGKAIEHRRPVHTGDFTLTSKPTDHTLIGRVVFEADGKPAAKARVITSGKTLTTDEDGRFRIESLAAGPFELHAMAFGTDAAPFDGMVTVPDAPNDFAYEVKLPRGAILKGRVADPAKGLGIANVQLSFTSKYDDNTLPSVFGFLEKTDADGRFRLVVPSRKGVLALSGIPSGFAQPEMRMTSQSPDPRFSKEIEAKAGQTLEIPDFKLARGGVVTLRVVDSEGKPIPDAQVDIRDLSRRFNQKPGKTDAEGRFAVTGLQSGTDTVVDVIAQGRKLGATVEVNDAGQVADLEVRLQPLVTISGRVLDDEGKPLRGAVVNLYRNVTDPGQSGRSFGTSAGFRAEIKEDGSYSFDTLIPGATYNTQVAVKGFATATSEHLKIKPGQPARLADLKLPALDQEVKGVVVDARGKPIEKITVNYDRSSRTRAMYAPRGGVWFQETDSLGRFHLNQLPRGAIRLQVYRNPVGSDRQIRDIQYVDVVAGQDEVRIVIRDRNDRLRGIE